MAAVTNVFTDTISVAYSGNGKTVNTKVATYTGTKDAGVAAVITAGAVNQEIDINFTVNAIQSLIMASDQNVTVKVNSTSSPSETFAIAKTSGLVWGSDYNTACPFSVTVTKFFVSNPGLTDAKFDFRVLYN